MSFSSSSPSSSSISSSSSPPSGCPPQSTFDKVSFRRAFIRREGTSVVGTSPWHSPRTVPEWFDAAAFGHAQQLYQTFSPVIGISQLYGLLLGITLYSGLAPLIATGQSATRSSLFLRYLSTNVHIRQWFTGGSPFQRDSASCRSLMAIRRLHRQVSSRLNGLAGGMALMVSHDNKKNDNHFKATDLWMSQWSMSQAQFAFMGLPTVFPEILGFGSLSSYDRHCMLHFWRTIGHCLGIEDRFNLCTGSDEEVTELCRQIYHLEWRPAIVTAPEVAGLAMAEDIALIMFRIVPIITYRALMHYVAPTFNLDAVPNYQLKTIEDYFFYEKFALWSKDVHRGIKES
ncbi:hypothetical protein TYRP_021195 [Tyrophagus putrescentiae]|nr:hypothetical protein TYRP_021195 [Tyrophagus putrescentiae]